MPQMQRSVDSDGSRSLPIPWRGLLIGWGLFSIVELVDRWLSFGSLEAAALLTAVNYPPLVLMSVGLCRGYERLFPERGLTALRMAMLISMCVVAAFCVFTFSTVIRIEFGWSRPDARPLEAFVIPAGQHAIAFLAWSLLYFWIATEAHRQEEQQHLVHIQMEALRAEIHELQLQLDPHFLINALNGIAEETHDSPERAVAMIADLTTYLRHVLAGLRTPVVSVRSEIEGMHAYLRLQQARFGGRVSVHLSVDPATTDRSVANLLFQPLVENAFEHGDRSVRLNVSIRVSLDGEALRINIENTGHLASTTKARPGHGLGLQNIQRRLEVHYPGRHEFYLRQVEDGGDTCVEAVLRLEGEPCSVS